MKKILLIFLALLLPQLSTAKIKVIASTNDLAYLAKQVGGDLIEVDRIAPPKADIHFIEVRPSYMMKVSRADVALKVGLELDMWMDKIIDGSRNSHLEIVDCSKYVHPLEVPTFKADARYGDLHRFGNPHYWLSPDNVKPITDAIVEGLVKADPDNGDQFTANQEKFLDGFQTVIDKLKKDAMPLQELEYISYHNTWPYFNQFIGARTVDFIEPYPGVPPTPSHIKDLIKLVKERDVKVIAFEPYFDPRVPDKIASETGVKVVELYPSIGGRSEDESYFDWYDGNIKALLGALK